MAQRIRVLVYSPDNLGPEVRVIANELGELQSIVGGYIEAVPLTRDLVVICNEEGRLLGLPVHSLGLAGVFIIARADGAEFAGLSDDDITKARSLADQDR